MVVTAIALTNVLLPPTIYEIKPVEGDRPLNQLKFSQAAILQFNK
ncbi:hypothetical protein [Nostoc edaphicum]|nr:hypothetical protein [Nostoc edaphicum]